VVRVAVFAEGAEAQEAIAAGADVVGADDLIDSIKESMHSFLSTYVLRSLFMVEGVNLGDTLVFDEGWTIEQIKLELPTAFDDV
jgi:ribosomal protein L1